MTTARTFEQRFLSGDELYGDDFGAAEISAWFEAEREGYAGLGEGEHGSALHYGYHKLNIRQGFRYLPPRRFKKALGLGSAYGGEFIPLMSRIDELTILEPSLDLRSNQIEGRPVRYVVPDPSGTMPFGDGTFDLVLALCTLHHIPNVSHVVAEMGRVTAPGGCVLVREPVTSMGDWRSPRAGLTPRERGIPIAIMRVAFAQAGLTVVEEKPCMFPSTRRLGSVGMGFNSGAGVLLDEFLSSATSWNGRYHSKRKWHKVRPTARFFVLQRQ